MSVRLRYSADTIVTDMNCNIAMTGQNNNDDNSRSSTAETQTQMFHRGRLGIPDAEGHNHPMESDDSNNNNNNNSNINTTNTINYNNNMNPININTNMNNSNYLMNNPLASTSSSVSETTPHKDIFEAYFKLEEALALEPKYQPNLFLPQQSNDGEITIGTRDGAAHVLRCLKVWYDLPNDVMFAAINLLDRFLTKMKVRPKHMACISVGSLHLAIRQLNLMPIDAEDLVAISQCRCTARDLERMADIIANKLGVQIGSPPVTGLTFIRLFYYIFKHAAVDLGLSEFYENAITLKDLEMRMEILACDASCASIRASELALVMLCTQMDAHVSNMETNANHQIHGLVDYAIQLQKMCRIPDSSFFHSHSTVVRVLSMYNGQQKMPYKQRLVWKLSSRTLRSLRPTDKLTSYLPTIEEDNNNLRYRTGSVSSEDGSEDWPTSPVVPVCEQC